ncbi:hypothetical protein pb186bvf_009241 [Paramecium bursaria]
MNRLLITDIGDQMRQEIKQAQSHEKTTKSPQLKLPDVRSSIQNSSLFSETDRYETNPLYMKSLSQIAMGNLTRTASLSLMGNKKQQVIEEQIREDLNLPENYHYLNRNLSKLVSKMVNDDVATKRKRQLLGQLKKYQKYQTENGLEISNYVEEADISNKLMELINLEGKMDQLHRRYLNKQKLDSKLQHNLKLSVDRLYEQRSLQIDSINPLSPNQISKMREFGAFKDQSLQRYHQRIQEKHKKKLVPIWESVHIPQQTKRWTSWIEQAKINK